MTEHQKHQSNSLLSVNRVLENIIKSAGLITKNISAKKERAMSLMQHNDENPCRCMLFHAGRSHICCYCCFRSHSRMLTS